LRFIIFYLLGDDWCLLDREAVSFADLPIHNRLFCRQHEVVYHDHGAVTIMQLRRRHYRLLCLRDMGLVHSYESGRRQGGLAGFADHFKLRLFFSKIVFLSLIDSRCHSRNWFYRPNRIICCGVLPGNAPSQYQLLVMRHHRIDTFLIRPLFVERPIHRGVIRSSGHACRLHS
jgi:hypothetical protein